MTLEVKIKRHLKEIYIVVEMLATSATDMRAIIEMDGSKYYQNYYCDILDDDFASDLNTEKTNIGENVMTNVSYLIDQRYVGGNFDIENQVDIVRRAYKKALKIK